MSADKLRLYLRTLVLGVMRIKLRIREQQFFVPVPSMAIQS